MMMVQKYRQKSNNLQNATNAEYYMNVFLLHN